RPTSHDEPFRYPKLERQDPDQGPIFPHSLQISHVSPYRNTQTPFKSPQSPGPSLANGLGNLTTSLSGSGSRSGSRSGSESGSFQYPPKEPVEYHDQQMAGRPLSRHGSLESVEESQRYPASGYAYSDGGGPHPSSYPSSHPSSHPSTPVGPLPGSTQPVLRQRHTSLPQVLNYQQPSSHEQHYHQHSQYHQTSVTPPLQYGFQAGHTGYYHRRSPPSPTYSQHHPDSHHHSQQQQQQQQQHHNNTHHHQYMQYEKSRRSMEERIRTHPSLEEEGHPT
ncbi:hypothetical protein BGX21_005875, partial [Mortierella sp. AD011]